MRGITQHFHGLQVDIQQRMPRRDHVHKDRAAARFEHPPDLTQRLADIVPVVRRIAADDQIEAGVLKRQRLRHALLQLNVTQAFFRRRLLHHRQHLRRQIVGHHLRHPGRRGEAGMPGAAAQIEQTRVGMRRQ